MTNVNFETVCLRLLIKGLTVPVRLWMLSIAYYYVLSLQFFSLYLVFGL